MKPVQVLFDEALLSELDSDDEVKKHGRSRVLRNLVSIYLRDRRQAIVDAQYVYGYGGDFKQALDSAIGFGGDQHFAGRTPIQEPRCLGREYRSRSE